MAFPSIHYFAGRAIAIISHHNKHLNNEQLQPMNILISIDLDLYPIVRRNWPSATIHETNSYNGMINKVFANNFDLLILDIDMAGGENLESFISKAATYCKVIVFSSRNRGIELRKMIMAGAHASLSSQYTRPELLRLLNKFDKKKDRFRYRASA